MEKAHKAPERTLAQYICDSVMEGKWSVKHTVVFEGDKGEVLVNVHQPDPDLIEDEWPVVACFRLIGNTANEEPV